MSDRRRSVLLAMLFGYASLGTSLARNILFVPLYLRDIPLAEYGAWLATGGALALLLINDFGLSGVVTQKISAAFGAGDHRSLGELTGSALGIGVLMAIVLSGVSLALAPVLPGLDSLGADQRHTVTRCFMIAIAANGLAIIGAAAGSALRSLHRVVQMGSVAFAGDVSNLAVTLVMLLRGDGLYAIAVGMLVRSLTLALAGMGVLLYVCAARLQLEVRVRPRAMRGLLGDSSRLFLSSIAMKLQSQGSIFLIGSVLGPSSVAVYSLTVRAHETVLMLIGQINAALVPSVTHLLGSGNLARFRAVLLRVLVSITLVTAFALTLTVVLDPAFLRLWVGSHAFAGQPVSVLMAAALFVSSLGYVAYDALLAHGRFQRVSNVFMATTLVQLLLLMLLLRHGLWVAPVLVLAAATAWGWLFWAELRRRFDLEGRELQVLLLEIARIAAVSAAVALAFSRWYPEPATWLGLAIEGAACGVTLAAAYLMCSGGVRALAREEWGTTLRVLRSS